MVKFYVRTRGFRVDYSFLPEQVAVNDLKDYKSDLEKPTCILKRTEKDGIFLLLASIPSQRKDYQGTRIRYDLVATANSECCDNDYEKQGLVQLIWLWLKDVKSGLYATQEDDKTSELVRLPSTEKSEVGKRLDEILPEDYLEGLLQRVNEGRCEEGDKKELNNKLKDLVLKISPEFVPKTEFNSQFWWGGVNNDFSRCTWIMLVKKILTDKNIYGKALLLNIANPQSLGRLTRGNGELGVLLAKEWSREQPSVIKIPLDTNVEILKKNPRITLSATKMAFFIIIAGFVLFFFGYFFGTKPFHLGNRIEEEEMLSWSESVDKDKHLLLEINGKIKGSERELVDNICVLSIINSRFFYLDGRERKKGNSCQGRSLVTVQNDGSWRFANTFANQQRRVIRVEKIYQDNRVVESRSYVDLTIGQS